MKTTLIIAVLVLSGASILHAQSCLPTSGTGSNLSNIEIGSMAASADGLIHVTYGFDGSVTQDVQTLFANAAQQWNGDLGTTGVVFEKAAAGQTPTISMSFDPANSLGCIAMNPQTGHIGFNSDWQQLVGNSSTMATASMAHELGHFLGLADAGPNPSQATIMNNPFTGTCANGQVHTTSVQFTDAQVGASCTSQAQHIQNPPSQPGCAFVPIGQGPIGELSCDGGGPGSPVIIDTEGEDFHLTSAANGVRFDISGTGHPVQIAWTDSHFHNAFLALPGPDALVHNGKQLFGNFTPQPPSSHPNGFLALAEFDKRENGGNGDGVIDEKDAVYSRLRLWIDENHDGISQPDELHTLPELGVYSISLNYSESQRKDRVGNTFRYKARVNSNSRHDFRDERQHGEANEVGRWAYDVFFMTTGQ